MDGISGELGMEFGGGVLYLFVWCCCSIGTLA